VGDGGDAQTAAYVAAAVALLVGIVNPLVSAASARRRSGEQFAHERKMRVRDENLQALDEATVRLATAWRFVERLGIYWKAGNDWKSQKVRSVVDEHNASIHDVRAAESRLTVRFGAESEVCKAYTDALTKTTEVIKAMEPWAAGDPFDAHLEEVQGEEDGFSDAEERFLKAARATLASE
jgi:hypothetical protein